MSTKVNKHNSANNGHRGASSSAASSVSSPSSSPKPGSLLGSVFVFILSVVYSIASWFLVPLFSLLSAGNPTQQVSKLFQMMSRGMAGNEDASAFDKLYVGTSGNNSQKATNDANVANSFYNLATEFYEYGWGDSFHFGFRKRNEPHSKCILNSQNFVAQKLQVGDMDRVLDLGCGIGGPLRGIVRATGASITGITINAFQVERAREITRSLTPYMQQRCHYDVQDYLNIDHEKYPANSFDAAFYMESSLHCEDRAKTFAEAFRVLKPGGRLVAMEYVLLDKWNPSNPEHIELMSKHLYGNGSAKTPTIQEDLAMFEKAGFQIKEHFDYMTFGDKLYGKENTFQWWEDLQWNWRFHLLPAHPLVRHTLPYLLKPLAKIGLIPKDVVKAAELMNIGGDGLSGLGKLGAITPQYYVLATKPL